MNASCATCKWSRPILLADGEPVNECHRFPPQVIVLNDEVTQVWPQMEETQWCGEYER